MVADDSKTKQDIANLILDFRDANWWVTPFIKNKTRILSTVATIFGLGVGSGHYGIPVFEKFRSNHRPRLPPPPMQVMDEPPAIDAESYRERAPEPAQGEGEGQR